MSRRTFLLQTGALALGGLASGLVSAAQTSPERAARGRLYQIQGPKIAEIDSGTRALFTWRGNLMLIDQDGRIVLHRIGRSLGPPFPVPGPWIQEAGERFIDDYILMGDLVLVTNRDNEVFGHRLGAMVSEQFPIPGQLAMESRGSEVFALNDEWFVIFDRRGTGVMQGLGAAGLTPPVPLVGNINTRSMDKIFGMQGRIVTTTRRGEVSVYRVMGNRLSPELELRGPQFTDIGEPVNHVVPFGTALLLVTILGDVWVFESSDWDNPPIKEPEGRGGRRSDEDRLAPIPPMR